jgi:hypothetical protein
MNTVSKIESKKASALAIMIASRMCRTIVTSVPAATIMTTTSVDCVTNLPHHIVYEEVELVQGPVKLEPEHKLCH